MGINLQVVMPYQKCVYNCPFCCARGKKHNYQFDNLYKTDYKEWQQKLIARCKEGDIDRVVITGEADPTQNYRFIEAVCETVPKKIPIELTTHNYNCEPMLANCYNRIHTVSYSITNSREYLCAWGWGINNCDYNIPMHRLVIILTDDFNFLTADNFNTMGFEQITFKTLQESDDEKVNEWIRQHKMDEAHLNNIREIVNKYNGNPSNCSIRLDESCQTATGRYEIFRSDGQCYGSWEAKLPITNKI